MKCLKKSKIFSLEDREIVPKISNKSYPERLLFLAKFWPIFGLFFESFFCRLIGEYWPIIGIGRFWFSRDRSFTTGNQSIFKFLESLEFDFTLCTLLRGLVSQWGNFMIFLSLSCYVESISGILELQNLPFRHILRLWILIFINSCTFWSLQFAKLLIFRAPEMEKMAVLEHLESAILISRKIWVAEKSSNFRTVYTFERTSLDLGHCTF